jgi:hypothetical protein
MAKVDVWRVKGNGFSIQGLGSRVCNKASGFHLDRVRLGPDLPPRHCLQG